MTVASHVEVQVSAYTSTLRSDVCARTPSSILGIKGNFELDLPTMLKAKEDAVGTLTGGIEYLFKKNGTSCYLNVLVSIIMCSGLTMYTCNSCGVGPASTPNVFFNLFFFIFF